VTQATSATRGREALREPRVGVMDGLSLWKKVDVKSGATFFDHVKKIDCDMDVSENSGFSLQIIHFNRVFHYFHHPFWGTPIFGNPHTHT